MHIERIAGALGAEITGIDLSTGVDEAGFQAIRQALLDHGMIYLPDQDITPEQQLAFARRFGEIHLHPHLIGLPEHPEVAELIKAETDKRNFGGGWHTDQMFLPEPVMATILYAKELPAYGGDTLFADLYTAYDSLSDGMKRMVGRLRTVNLPDAGRPRNGSAGTSAQYNDMASMRLKPGTDYAMQSVHPLVRTHPETGRKALYVGLHTERFDNMTVAESAPLLNFLIEHATRPEFTCRLRWRERGIAIWDNRRLLHNAINDYPGQRRRMHRITVAGDRPY